MSDTTEMQKKIDRVRTLIRPLNNQIAIIPEDKETVTASGVYLPENAGGVEVTGVVAAIGPQALVDHDGNQVEDIEIGDRVFYDAFSTKDIKIIGQPITLVMRENCLCVIKSADKVEEVKR